MKVRHEKDRGASESTSSMSHLVMKRASMVFIAAEA